MTPRIPTAVHKPYPPEVGAEAAHWLLRFQDTQPEPDDPYFDKAVRDQAFLDWLIISPQHVCAFLEIFETYQRLGNMDPQGQIHIPTLLRQVSLKSEGSRQRSVARRIPSPVASRFRKMREPRPLTLIGSAVAAGITAIFFLVGRWPLLPIKGAAASVVTYATAVGERTIIPLEDGSVLTLNTASRVEVAFDWRVRRVRLLTGEVLVKVHHEATRSFEVVSDSVSVSDLGTEFDVYRRPAGVRVFVVEGKVRVAYERGQSREAEVSSTYDLGPSPPRNRASAMIPLAAGEEVDLATEPAEPGISHRTRTVQQIQNAISWREGHLSFKGDLLSDEVDELNRYNTRQLVIADPRIANYRVGGTFVASDVDGFVDALRDTWGIQVLPQDPGNSNPGVIRLGLTNSADPVGSQ